MNPSPWKWLEIGVLRAIHEAQLVEHGGGAGLRDFALLESTLARPRQLADQGTPDHAELAAAYGYGIALNAPFIHGNKRLALVAVELFLALNDYGLRADDADCALVMLAVAANQLEEAAFAEWLRRHTIRR